MDLELLLFVVLEDADETLCVSNEDARLYTCGSMHNVLHEAGRTSRPASPTAFCKSLSLTFSILWRSDSRLVNLNERTTGDNSDG